MSYPAPIGNAVDFVGGAGYIPPAGDAVLFAWVLQFKIVGRSAPAFNGIANTYVDFSINSGSLFKPETKERDVVIAGTSITGFVTDQRNTIFSGASTFTVDGYAIAPGATSIIEGSVPTFEAIAYQAGTFREDLFSVLTLNGVMEAQRNIRIRTKSEFISLASFNKQMSFAIYGGSRFSPKSSFNSPRSCSISAHSETRFKCISEAQTSFHSVSNSGCGFVGECAYSAKIDWSGSSSADFLSDHRSTSSLFITNGSSCVFDGTFSTETLLPPSPDGAEMVFVRTRTHPVVVVSA